jgi:yabG peptidase U57
MDMKVGDYVTRKKYNHDIIFRIIKIEDNKVFLHGEMFRLIADTSIDDLELYSSPVDEKEIKVLIDQDNSMIKGKILHVDGDKTYLEKCMNFYKEYTTPVVGCHLQEDKMKENIIPLLKKHQPDILIITGHDSFSFKRENEHEGYKNSHHFIETVKQARLYQPNKDALIIIAGACQSNYEGLIKSGANFASSPTKINIHALDPACIAVSIANTHVNQYVEVEKVLKDTVSKGKGMGGIDSKGVARKIYSTK